MRRRITINRDLSRGSYTIEGAFAIVIFTILMMMLLSMITVIETETEIQSAVNQTAMQLSQYSYAVGGKPDTENNETEVLKNILKDAKREALGFATGSALTRLLTRDRIDEKALSLVDGGYDGLNFSMSNVLGDGRNISVNVIYRINVPTYGLVNKQLLICQKAQTAAWLPYNAAEFAAPDDENAEEDSGNSIWKETNFTRGRYFVRAEKDKYPELAVKAGQGIDLYDKEKGRVAEVYSMNIFNPSYSTNAEGSTEPSGFTPDEKAIGKQLREYVRSLKKDISNPGETVTMESGAEEMLSVKSREMIIVLPNEAEGLPAYDAVFNDFKNSAKEREGITITFVYSEDAL